MDALGVDPLMDHADAVAVLRRILVALPARRGVTPIRCIQAQHIGRVAYPDAHGVIKGGGKLRVEVEIRTARAIEKLEITKQRNAWPNVLHEKKFAPSGMTDDDVGRKSFPF